MKNKSSLLAYSLVLLCAFVSISYGTQRRPAPLVGSLKAVLEEEYSVEELVELSSSDYEGRGVGTEGLQKARDFLQGKLQAAGIEPAFRLSDGSGSYLQPLQVFIGNDLGERNLFQEAAKGEFIPLAFSRSGKVENLAFVFAGFGISAQQEGAVIYDDYAGLDVKGKVVMVLTGDPGTGNKDSFFRNPAFYHYSSPMYKVQNAELKGAAGIIFVRDPLSLNDGEVEGELRFQSRQGGGATVDILAGQITQAVAQKYLDRPLKEIQETIAKTQKPLSFALTKNTSFEVDISRRVGSVENVAGFLPGNDPILRNEVIVVGAHYDHLGYGGDASMDPNKVGEVHPGADDNASGTQMVLNLARRWKNNPAHRRSIVVVFFTAEEIGLVGSKNFVTNLPLSADAKLVGMINLDMVGRLQDEKLSVLALRSGKEFSQYVDEANFEFNFQIVKGDSGFGSSDHASFLQLKVPSLFFTTGAHLDYHRPSDTAEKINVDGMKRIENFVYAVWRKIDASGGAPTYDPAIEEGNEPSRPGRGYGVYFGSIPEMGGTEEIVGVLLQGARAGSPAEEAGLQKGDVLVGLGEIKVRNLQDLVFALRFYRPNEVVSVEWVRAGAKMKASVKLRKREG